MNEIIYQLPREVANKILIEYLSIDYPNQFSEKEIENNLEKQGYCIEEGRSLEDCLDLDLDDNITIYQVQLFLYNYVGWFVKISFILFMTGILTTKPPYVDEINFIIKLSASLFLIYRFKTYRITLTELDRRVASSAGLYIFVLSFADILRKNIYFKDFFIFYFLFFLFQRNTSNKTYIQR